MSWFRKRKHQFRGVLAFLHPQFLHYSQLAAVLEAPRLCPSYRQVTLTARRRRSRTRSGPAVPAASASSQQPFDNKSRRKPKRFENRG